MVQTIDGSWVDVVYTRTRTSICLIYLRERRAAWPHRPSPQLLPCACTRRFPHIHPNHTHPHPMPCRTPSTAHFRCRRAAARRRAYFAFLLPYHSIYFTRTLAPATTPPSCPLPPQPAWRVCSRLPLLTRGTLRSTAPLPFFTGVPARLLLRTPLKYNIFLLWPRLAAADRRVEKKNAVSALNGATPLTRHALYSARKNKTGRRRSIDKQRRQQQPWNVARAAFSQTSARAGATRALWTPGEQSGA